MSSKRIADLPTKNPTDAMKIPTGGFGDYAVTIKSISEWLVVKYSLVTEAELKLVDETLKSLIELKADKTSLYTKEEVDSIVEQAKGQLEQSIQLIDSRVGSLETTVDSNYQTLSQNKADKNSVVSSVGGRKGDVTFQQIQDGLNLGDLADKNEVDVLVDSKLITWSNRTQEEKNKDFVSVHDYCKCDGTDETVQFQKAISVAKAENKKLVSYYGTLKVSSDCNLRFINFDLSGTDIITSVGKMLIIGATGGSSFYKQQKLGLVRQDRAFSLNPDLYTIPTVRIMGSKCLNFEFNQIDYLQLYMSTDPLTFPADASIGYCTITGGLATRLELDTDPRYANGSAEDGAGSANQWANSNDFYINRLIALDIRGSYPHNHNIFHEGCFETSGKTRINIEIGNKNQFLNIRGEGSPTIFFGERTKGNCVSRAWFSAESNYLSYSNVTDLGTLNKVTSTQEELSTRIPIISLNSQYDTMFNGKSGNYAFNVPSRKILTATLGSRILQETQPFLINVNDFLHFSCNTIDESILSRYTARIQFYDSNRALCTDVELDWIMSSNFNTLTQASGMISGQFYSSAASYLSLTTKGKSRVRYISIQILTSSSVSFSLSSMINVSLLTMRGILKRPETMSVPVVAMNYVTAKPTAFVGKVGDVVQGLDTTYRCRLMRETNLTEASEASSTGVTVTTLAGAGGTGAVMIGDLIGVDLDDNTIHWTTITALSGFTATLSTPLPSQASIGNNVYISRLI